MFNGPIHVLAKTIKAVMASAMEAEMKALLMSAQLLAERRQALEDMGHPQPPTRARVGSKPAHGPHSHPPGLGLVASLHMGLQAS